MNLRRYLRPESVKLELATLPEPLETEEPDSPAHHRRLREGVVRELVGLFAATNEVVNEKRLLTDILNREKKASTAYGDGIALPHVRTLQARTFIMCFARSRAGIPFGAPDEKPCQVFFGMVAPPYDDRLYLRVYRTLAPLLMDPEWRDGLMAAEDPHEILRLLEVVCR